MKVYPDISHHKKVTDWGKLKSYCPFIISKATQGTGFVDPSLEKFIVSCENLGIPYWVYTYLNKGNELKQAKFLVETCKRKVGKYFVGYVLDAEENNHPQDVLEALTWLEKQGTKCMLYIGYRHYILYEDVIKELGNNTALWEARYGLNNGEYSSKYTPHDLTDLHQYTDKGKCPGVAGFNDLNRLTGRKKESWFTTPLKKAVSDYYKSCNKNEDSIVDGLKSIGVNSSYANRAKIAKANGIVGYKGTATENNTLLSLLKAGKLRRV